MIKTVSWRIIASFLTIAIVYAVTRDILAAVSVMSAEFFTKMALYWGHEKGWGFINMPEKGSKLRSFIKTITWRVVASVTTFSLVYAFDKKPDPTDVAVLSATYTVLFENILKPLTFYFHERLWNINFNLDMTIDLHTHSTCSDGSASPQEIIQLAIDKGCEYISITDHDNIDHLSHVGEIPDIIKFIPGVEISAEHKKTLHILGYGFDPENKELKETLKSLVEARRERNVLMLKKMAEQGFHITMDELAKESKGGIVGRPHFANLMLQKGYVENYQEAFDKYLAKGQSLYMDKFRLDPKVAIELILAAGGIPVMAHPYQTGLSSPELEGLIKELRSYGLIGIEVYYSQHSKEQMKEYLGYAKKYDLLPTAGSDFHGSFKPDIELGMTMPHVEVMPFLELLEK